MDIMEKLYIYGNHFLLRKIKGISMARFSEIEIKLLNKYLKKTRYYTSLALIREAMEDIWNKEVRIIRGFTDHGEEHSERLIGFANKLLESNDGKELSDKEIYLLFAGIYLHDIGMQCDVVKLSTIKARAEGLGAKFDVKFTAETANDYSLEEQKAIRNNHHFLTAAWIDYAYKSGETVLKLAMETVPEKLVDDLMDVCMYHSKLPISDCPKTYTIYPGRKRMIAALLRFSDELDIDSKRVIIETVKNFSLSPHDSIFWWLHHSTEISIINRNIICLKIILHPKDFKEHGSFIKRAFIQEFQNKNLPLLRVLEMENIPIKFSDDSNIFQLERSESLPREIIEELQKMKEESNPLEKLTEKVYTYLQTLKYEVGEPKNLDGRTVDILATIESGIFKQRVLVRCIEDEITQADVRELNKILNIKIPQGWLICDNSISDTVYEIIKKDDDIKVFRLSEFLEQEVPFYDYKGVI